MKMKKNLLILILLLAGFFFIIPSQVSAAPVDMVVLLDTSESVLPIYGDLVNYIIKDILTNHLRYGDTFHLINFDSTPSLIFSKQIKNSSDIEYVLSDLFLLYPLGKYTDLIAALKYLRSYVSGISNNSSREIVILTDGIHDPPPGSPYKSVIDPATGENLLQKEIQELTKSNWKVSIVRLPGENESALAGMESRQNGASGSSSASQERGAASAAGGQGTSLSDTGNSSTSTAYGTAETGTGQGKTDLSASGTYTYSGLVQGGPAAHATEDSLYSQSYSQASASSSTALPGESSALSHTVTESAEEEDKALSGTEAASGQAERVIEESSALSLSNGSTSSESSTATQSDSQTADSTQSLQENSIFNYLDNNDKIYKSDFNDSVGEKSTTTATGSPKISIPGSIDKINYNFKLPLQIENFYSYPVFLKLDQVILNNAETNGDTINIKQNILSSKETIAIPEKRTENISLALSLPKELQPGESKLMIELVFSDDNRAFPTNFIIAATIEDSFFNKIITKAKDNILKIVIVLVIIVVIIIFALVLKYLLGLSVTESYNVVRKDIDKEGIDSGGRRPIIMKTAGQNDKLIGKRNIHIFKDGTVRSVGGGNSSYLIFLYKLPGVIASLKFDGSRYIFTPIKPQFFPEIGDKEFENPLNTDIKIITEKKQALSIKFMEYISPLEKINSIMKLTEQRGIPEQQRKAYYA